MLDEQVSFVSFPQAIYENWLEAKVLKFFKI